MEQLAYSGNKPKKIIKVPLMDLAANLWMVRIRESRIKDDEDLLKSYRWHFYPFTNTS